MLHAMSLHTVLGLLAYLVNKILISLTSLISRARRAKKLKSTKRCYSFSYGQAIQHAAAS